MERREKMLRATTAVIVALASLSVGAVFAANEPTKQEREVEYRQSLYTVMGGNFGPLGDMADGKVPYNAVEARKRADRVAFLAPMLKEAFPADSNGVAHTAAKPEIWTDTVEFDKALQNLLDKSAALAAAAKTGDPDKLKDAVQDTRKACKGCHEKFRAKD